MTNVVVLIGRLTKDIDLKKSQSGMSVARFTLAVNRMKKDEADFISCVVFDKRADTMYQYLGKGSLVGIEGHLQTGSYDKNGVKVYTTDVIVDGFDFLESRSDRQTKVNNYEPSYESSESIVDISNEDLPF